MAKKIKDNPIALPLEEYESKIKELQEYLKKTPIKTISDYSERHDEIKIQVLVMKELPGMLKEWKLLLVIEEENKPSSDPIRGDVPLSPLENGDI